MLLLAQLTKFSAAVVPSGTLNLDTRTKDPKFSSRNLFFLKIIMFNRRAHYWIWHSILCTRVYRSFLLLVRHGSPYKIWKETEVRESIMHSAKLTPPPWPLENTSIYLSQIHTRGHLFGPAAFYMYIVHRDTTTTVRVKADYQYKIYMADLSGLYCKFVYSFSDKYIVSSWAKAFPKTILLPGIKGRGC